MNELEFHQARLLASSIRREIRKALKKPEHALTRIERAKSLTRSLIEGLR